MRRDDRGVAGVGLSLTYTAETLADLGPALDAFAPLDLDSAEIFLPSLGVVMGGRVRRPALAELRRLCADRPFAFTVHGPLCGNFGDHENAALHRDVFRASLEAAAEIGSRVLVWHGATVRDADPAAVEAARAAERETLSALAPEAAAHGVVLCVETMYGDRDGWSASPAELAAQLAAVDHPNVRATIDFSHSALNATARGLDYLAEIRALAPYAGHLHIHDSFGRPASFRPWSRGDAMSYGFGDLHLPPGAGSLPWDDLARLSYAGPAVANLELNPSWRAEWPDAIAWTRRWIEAGRARSAAGGDGL